MINIDIDRKRFAFILIMTLSLLIYCESWHNPFVFDDESFVLLNESVHQVQDLKYYFGQSLMDSGGMAHNAGIYFRPLVAIIYSLLWQVGGGDPLPFRIFEWLMHTMSSFMVFPILMFFFSKRWALLGALIFLLHPLNTEAAVYISDLADVLSLFLGL